MTKRDALVAFLFGGLAGAGLTWSLATAAERFRRIRDDLRAARAGIKTLRKLLVREGTTLLKVAAVVVLIVGVAAAFLTTG